MRGLRFVLTAAVLSSPIWLIGCSAREPAPSPGRVEQLLVWADAEPEEGAAPLTVQFSVDPLEEIKDPEYQWDFADGSSAEEGDKVEHTYTRAGTFKVQVRVRDAKGNVGDDTILIDVE